MCKMLLSDINSNPRDKRVKFYEEPHIYEIEGYNGKVISVTTFIHSFFPKFDDEEAAEKAINAKMPKYPGMTKEEIISLWKENASLGTEMHKMIENYINIGGELPKTIEAKYFLDFWGKITSLGYTPYRTEWVIYDEEYGIAGSIDLVLKCPEGGYAICDWKRSKEIKASNKYSKGYSPLSHLDDCNLNHYALQLNCYRHILERCYGIAIQSLFLVVIHPNNPNFIMIPVPRIEHEIGFMWEARKAG